MLHQPHSVKQWDINTETEKPMFWHIQCVMFIIWRLSTIVSAGLPNEKWLVKTAVQKVLGFDWNPNLTSVTYLTAYWKTSYHGAKWTDI